MSEDNQLNQLDRVKIKYPDIDDNEFSKKIGSIFRQYKIKPKNL